jgi:biopolymer transport protein ExbD
MAVFQASGNDRAMSQINITPLVDVMLVLLVIFMIATPAVTHTLDWQLPQPGPQLPTPPKEMTLQVQAGDTLALDGQALSRSELGAVLAGAVTRDPNVLVNVQVDPAAEYSEAVSAMATARNAGVDNLSVMTY